MTVTREELNGLGQRVGEVELLEPQVKRNSSDIQKVFDELAKIPAQNQALLNKIVFLMLIPIGLSIWKLVAG